MRGVDASYVHLSGLIIRRRKKARKKQAKQGKQANKGSKLFNAQPEASPPLRDSQGVPFRSVTAVTAVKK
jgi:hypothetical protein